MRWILVLISWIPAVWMLHSCDSNRESSDTLDYAEIRSELLKDSALQGQKPIIDSIIEFYKKELPHQFSQRIILSTGEANEVFLDAMDDRQIDSLRVHFDPSSNIRIVMMADNQIVEEEYMINSIRHALSSTGRYLWNQSIPDSIFLNYLLPYKVIHEYPGSWWDFLEPYYRDSLSMWSSPSYMAFDARDARWIQRFTTAQPGDLPKWWIYDGAAQTFAKYPSLSEILLLRKGGCYLESMINVMILRTCGIPATIDEIPFWGSMNGSHAGDVYWSSKAQKMITGYERAFYNPGKYRRPAKVIRYTYRYTGAYSDRIAPYLNGEELQIPQMRGDHWYDATADHTTVSDIKIPVSHRIAERMDLGYLYVMNYGEWVPVDFGMEEGDSLCFTSIGRDVIYRTGFYSGGKHYLTGIPFLLDTLGVMRYSNPDKDRTRTINTAKINHGKESGVVSGRTYTLRYMDSEGEWQDLGTKRCKIDGELIFREVPTSAFYFLFSSSDQRQLARIFLVNENGELLWY